MNVWKQISGVVNKPRVLHYIDIFLAAFGMALLFNRQHILAAHGLNAVKAVVFACAVAGGKAVIEAYRKSNPQMAAQIDAAIDETTPQAK